MHSKSGRSGGKSGKSTNNGNGYFHKPYKTNRPTQRPTTKPTRKKKNKKPNKKPSKVNVSKPGRPTKSEYLDYCSVVMNRLASMY